MTKNDAKKRARKACNRKKGKVDIDLPMATFIYLNIEKNSQKYGHSICSKLIHDLQLERVNSRKKRGDAKDEFGNFYEIKTSVSSLDDLPGEETFAITHIRDTHMFDYFMFVFIHFQDDLKLYFYLIPKDFLKHNYKLGTMNKTAEENKFNLFRDERIDIKCTKVFEEFGKVNLLDGTSIKDLKNYFKNKRSKSNQYVNPMGDAIVSSVNKTKPRSTYKSHEKFAFEVNGRVIRGNTNIETITMLVNHLGPFEAMKVFSKSWLSPEKNKYRTVKTSHGNLYLNPKLSLRDLHVCIRRSKKRSNLNIRLIE